MPFQLQLFPAADTSPPAERVPPAPPREDVASAPRIQPPPETGRQPEPPGAEVLLRRLRALMTQRLGSVTLTDNRSTIVSARQAGGRGGLDVRMQRCFSSAPTETLVAVATFLSSDKRSSVQSRALAVIREYSARHRPEPATQRRRRLVLRPVGQTVDLREVRDEINRRYFDDELEVHVTWGRAPARRRRSRRNVSVRLGTYGHHDRVVRIHRCLDRPNVPRYVVESVVYHEMLHAAMPPVVKNGRRRVHTPEFRRRERLFPNYQRAERWLDRNLQRLL